MIGETNKEEIKEVWGKRDDTGRDGSGVIVHGKGEAMRFGGDATRVEVVVVSII